MGIIPSSDGLSPNQTRHSLDSFGSSSVCLPAAVPGEPDNAENRNLKKVGGKITLYEKDIGLIINHNNFSI